MSCELVVLAVTHQSSAGQEVSRRSLRNECLRLITARQYLAASSGASPQQLATEQEAAKQRVNLALDQYFLSARSCMTDMLAALASLLAM